jgi:hypothetical protein
VRVLLPLRRKRRPFPTPLAALHPPSRRRSARTALACGLLATLAATVGMTAAVETVKPEWRDPEFGHRLKRLRQAEAQSPDRPLVLVLGTSRAQNAIHPGAMGFTDEPGSPRVFNFALSASPPLAVLLNLLRLLDAGVRPAAVVVEVLPVWLASNGPAEAVYAGKANRLSAGDLHRLAAYCDNPAALRREWLAARVAPWYGQRFVLMSHWLPRWVPWSSRVDFQWNGVDPDGFTPFPQADPTPEVRAKATAHARQEYASVSGVFRPGAPSVRALRDLVARCLAEDIPVAFAVAPVAPGFRAWFRPRAWAAADAGLHELARELAVPVFPPAEFPDAGFVDGHHMLPATAAAYSRWLAEHHLKPWLAGNGGVP